MSEGPWIRFFPSDWLAGTRGMTAAETGIYITLVAMMYERGEPIHNDISRLARLCGTTTAALKSSLSTLVSEGKITLVDDALWNDRVGVETEIRREKSSSAKKSADTRWGKDKENQQSEDANALPKHSARNANQKPEARKEDATASLRREFDEIFWPAYPRKAGKGDALKAFIKARGHTSLEIIMAGVRRYAQERAGEDAKFTKHPQGWLNGAHWNDEPVPKRVTSTGPPQRQQAETVGSLSRKQLFTPKAEIDVTDYSSGRVDASGSGRLSQSAGDARTVALPDYRLGSF